LSAKDEEQGILPSAFDAKNYGFHVGQGAALAVFDSEKIIDKSEIYPIAELMGAYSASESSTNAIGQCENGEGFVKAIEGALKRFQCLIKTNFYCQNPRNWDTIKQCGGENSVKKHAERVCRHFLQAKDRSHNGSKWIARNPIAVGTTLKKVLFLPLQNRTQTDKVFLSEPISPPQGLILSLAAGMGNIYSAAILKGM
jgi:hypothetical protein